jgi:DNA-binding response OmpR family regulator
MQETILVVDDQANVQRLLGQYLTDKGYRVLAATDGSSALSSAIHDLPDLVLLDVSIPGLDGDPLIKLIRQYRRIPVILMAEQGANSDAVSGLELGADDYVLKPFRLNELLARIRAILRRANRLDQKAMPMWVL